MREVVRIGACQTPEILGDVGAAVGCIKGFCERAEPHVGFGPTSVMNPSADVVAQVPHTETGMVAAQVPA
jgi:hypothetical protein